MLEAVTPSHGLSELESDEELKSPPPLGPLLQLLSLPLLPLLPLLCWLLWLLLEELEALLLVELEALLLAELDMLLFCEELLVELDEPDEPLPLLLGPEELGPDELFELLGPLPEPEGPDELLLGPDELLELDELLLDPEELLELEALLLLLGLEELGGLLPELEELLDSEFSLIGVSSAVCCTRSPLHKLAHRKSLQLRAQSCNTALPVKCF